MKSQSIAGKKEGSASRESRDSFEGGVRESFLRFESDSGFLESVIDNLPVALFAKDVAHEYRFVLWNKKQEQITTIKREHALGKTDFDIFSKESANYFREVDERVVKRGKLFDVPEEIVDTKKGGEVWLHTVKVPIRDGNGDCRLLVGISEDITERIHVREQLEKLNQNLSAKNEELEAMQLQLIQAEKLESVGRLAAGVAHEVKNPLALLLMGVEYLSSGIEPGDPNIEEILTEMREAINRADKIIRGLVDFSSNRHLDRELTHLPTLIEHTLLLVRHELTKNSVNVDIEFEKDLPDVMIDSAKFEQILLNLFMNAIHAMKGKPKPNLEVLVYTDKLKSVERDEGVRTKDHLRSGDDVVILEVKDNGTGISEEHMQRLFDPFFTTKATGIGTGLGLSVVRKIVELHGGTVGIRNRLLGGAAVRITLKLRKPAEKN